MIIFFLADVIEHESLERVVHRAPAPPGKRPVERHAHRTSDGAEARFHEQETQIQIVRFVANYRRRVHSQAPAASKAGHHGDNDEHIRELVIGFFTYTKRPLDLTICMFLVRRRFQLLAEFLNNSLRIFQIVTSFKNKKTLKLGKKYSTVRIRTAIGGQHAAAGRPAVLGIRAAMILR
jgi:hypothetical protein